MLRPYNQHKFDFTSSLCLCLGYDPHRKGYLCLTDSDKTIFSWHVIFNEYIFPYSMPDTPFKLSDTTYIEPHPSPSPFTVVSISPASSFHDNHTESLPMLPSASSYSSPSPTSTPMEAPNLNIHPMITRAKDDIYKPKVF